MHMRCVRLALPTCARRLGALSLCLSLLLTVASPVARAAGDRAQTMAWMTSAMQQLVIGFYDPRLNLYRVSGGQNEPIASLWPTSQALAAAIEVARLTQTPDDEAVVQRTFASLRQYAAGGGIYHSRIQSWNATPIISPRYTDDNNWIALDLLDAYDVWHDPADLTGAEQIFQFAVSRWNARYGGIIWKDDIPTRPIVSNASTVVIGARLAMLTGQPLYAAWASRIYGWINGNLRAATGLYWDHINVNGTIDKDIVSYNQGLMIEANLALARLTGLPVYLNEARHVAAAANAALPNLGQVRGNNAGFAGIFFRALADLNAAARGAVDLSPAREFVQSDAATALAPRTTHTQSDMLEQAAFVITSAALLQ
jgi:predicted alpha-1,6-mannanase (GH76 family)